MNLPEICLILDEHSRMESKTIADLLFASLLGSSWDKDAREAAVERYKAEKENAVTA